MAEQDKPPSFDELEARLRAARAREDEKTGRGLDQPPSSAGMGLGFRLAVEFVVGTLVGAGIGYALDAWLGTVPWLMVVFLLLGAGAGISNAYRAAKGLDETVGLGEAQRRADGEAQRRAERSKDD